MLGPFLNTLPHIKLQKNEIPRQKSFCIGRSYLSRRRLYALLVKLDAHTQELYTCTLKHSYIKDGSQNFSRLKDNDIICVWWHKWVFSCWKIANTGVSPTVAFWSLLKWGDKGNLYKITSLVVQEETCGNASKRCFFQIWSERVKCMCSKLPTNVLWNDSS